MIPDVPEASSQPPLKPYPPPQVSVQSLIPRSVLVSSSTAVGRKYPVPQLQTASTSSEHTVLAAAGEVKPVVVPPERTPSPDQNGHAVEQQPSVAEEEDDDPDIEILDVYGPALPPLQRNGKASDSVEAVEADSTNSSNNHPFGSLSAIETARELHRELRRKLKERSDSSRPESLKGKAGTSSKTKKKSTEKPKPKASGESEKRRKKSSDHSASSKKTKKSADQSSKAKKGKKGAAKKRHQRQKSESDSDSSESSRSSVEVRGRKRVKGATGATTSTAKGRQYRTRAGSTSSSDSSDSESSRTSESSSRSSSSSSSTSSSRSSTNSDRKRTSRTRHRVRRRSRVKRKSESSRRQRPASSSDRESQQQQQHHHRSSKRSRRMSSEEKPPSYPFFPTPGGSGGDFGHGSCPNPNNPFLAPGIPFPPPGFSPAAYRAMMSPWNGPAQGHGQMAGPGMYFRQWGPGQHRFMRSGRNFPPRGQDFAPQNNFIWNQEARMPAGAKADSRKSDRILESYKRYRPWVQLRTEDELRSSAFFRLKMMSFNVLAQDLLEGHRFLYKFCTNEDLTWEVRRERIFQAIKEADPTVLCMQEIQDIAQENDFRPVLTELGYDGLFIERPHLDFFDGVAIYWKKSDLSLVDSECFTYFKSDSRHLNRHNVGIVARFRVPGTGLEFCVGTTHLLFNPKRHDVRLAQTQMLLAHLDDLAMEDDGGYTPVFVCGDLNFGPDNPVYSFLRNGSLDVSSVEPWSNDSDGWIPPSVGLSDCSRFERTMDRRKQGPPIYNSGLLSHGFHLASACPHFKNEREVGTTRHRGWCTVDYIFHSECSRVRVLGYQDLISREEKMGFPDIPNAAVGSDHTPLLVEFALFLKSDASPSPPPPLKQEDEVDIVDGPPSPSRQATSAPKAPPTGQSESPTRYPRSVTPPVISDFKEEIETQH